MFDRFDVLLVTNPVNVRYLTGFDGSFGWALCFDFEGEEKVVLITDARYRGYVDTVLKEGVEVVDLNKRPFDNLGEFFERYKTKKVGYESKDFTVHRLMEFEKKFGDVEFVETTDVILSRRMIKSDEEIDLIEKSQAINEDVFREVKSRLAYGVTEREVAWMIEDCARAKGCEKLAFDSIVAFGNHSACPHHRVTDRKLVKGDVVLIDMGVVYKGYHSDMTRTFFTTGPSAKQKEVYELVLGGQMKALDEMAAGMDVVDADGLGRSVIGEGGYEKEFCHSLGHGVGLEIHESPALSVRGKGVLKSGMVVTVEPGIYIDGEFGVRIEDLVLIEDDGVRNFTTVDKKPETFVVSR